MTNIFPVRMKSILAISVTLCLLLTVKTASAESPFNCLKRVVTATVGSDPKYTKWLLEVNESSANAYRMMSMCESVPAQIKPMCYKNVMSFIEGATQTLANKLSTIDPSIDWSEITKPCLKTSTHHKNLASRIDELLIVIVHA